MTALRTLMMLLGTLAVLMLGGVSAMAETPPPCHEPMSGHPAPDAPPATDGPIQAMGCCVACVASPTLTPPSRTTVVLNPDQPTALLIRLPPGRSEIPAHGPPRLDPPQPRRTLHRPIHSRPPQTPADSHAGHGMTGMRQPADDPAAMPDMDHGDGHAMTSPWAAGR